MPSCVCSSVSFSPRLRRCSNRWRSFWFCWQHWHWLILDLDLETRHHLAAMPHGATLRTKERMQRRAERVIVFIGFERVVALSFNFFLNGPWPHQNRHQQQRKKHAKRDYYQNKPSISDKHASPMRFDFYNPICVNVKLTHCFIKFCRLVAPVIPAITRLPAE